MCQYTAERSRWQVFENEGKTVISRVVVKLSGQKIFTKEPKTASGNRRVYISKEMCKLLKPWKPRKSRER